jgi:hypothetical protein
LTRARSVVARLDGRIDAVDGQLSRLLRQSEARDGDLARQLSELQASVRHATRRAGLRRAVTRVLLVVHHVEAWDSCDELYRLLAADDDFEPVVVSVPRRFPGSADLRDEERNSAGLNARSVPHLRLAATAPGEIARLLRAIDPDVVFRQSQWDPDLPEDLGTDALSWARMCLVPYETVNLVRNPPAARGADSAVDSEYHRAAWRVYCANDLVEDAARERSPLAGLQYRVTGHPKADRLRRAEPAWPMASRPSTARLVWSAHHTIHDTWTSFGTFHLAREDVLAWAAAHPGVQVLFMPHPALLTFVGCAASPVSAAQMEEWLERWEALPNTGVLREADYAPALAASDVMLTDGLSMLLEYQVLGKPLVFLERSGHAPFTPAGEVARTGVHAAPDAAAALALVDRFLQGAPDPLRAQQQRNVERLLGRPGAAGRILDDLRHAIEQERGAG